MCAGGEMTAHGTPKRLAEWRSICVPNMMSGRVRSIAPRRPGNRRSRARRRKDPQRARAASRLPSSYEGAGEFDAHVEFVGQRARDPRRRRRHAEDRRRACPRARARRRCARTSPSLALRAAYRTRSRRDLENLRELAEESRRTELAVGDAFKVRRSETLVHTLERRPCQFERGGHVEPGRAGRSQVGRGRAQRDDRVDA